MFRKAARKLTAGLERASHPFRGVWPRFPDALIGIWALGIVAVALVTFSVPLARYASTLVGDNKYVALLDGLLNPFRNRHLLLGGGLPIYELKLGRPEFVKIEAVVAQARKQGWLSDELKVWVRAKFLYEGQAYPVQVRVCGDLSNHWSGPKKSWAIKFGNQTMCGLARTLPCCQLPASWPMGG